MECAAHIVLKGGKETMAKALVSVAREQTQSHDTGMRVYSGKLRLESHKQIFYAYIYDGDFKIEPN